LSRPESVYGIVPDLSEEANVVALYGPGYFEDKEGDAGRRTYVTSSPRAVVRFIFGTDKVVESIDIDADAPLPHLSPSELKRITVRLEPRHWDGDDVAQLLAKGRGEVEAWYGAPAEDKLSATWTYETPDSEECAGGRLE